ncbi:MAG: DEAD/DEAH box helicase [Pirellulaceae bacterium]|nr:DEAD/DEAH box helicase [Pirellulaceae bacterium]
MKFTCFSLSETLLDNLEAAGYREATHIQKQAIPKILQGRDLVGCAQTGTGKTAAFALPTLERLKTSSPPPSGAQRRRQRTGRRTIRALILAPTRELAGQIGDSLKTYGKSCGLRHTVIFGGVSQNPQVKALQQGVDILVATPGRLLDLIRQGFVNLATVEILILDEADQMLDMGFIHDLRKIVAHIPDQRQTLMFSATMPKEIRDLAKQWLRRPCEVQSTPIASTPERVSQVVYFIERNRKTATLGQLLSQTQRSKTIVFSRTRRGADKVAKFLQRDGIRAVAIHGDKSQSRRRAVMLEFNSSRPPVLIATDLAARGIDFSDVSHVINFDLPETPETYVHRIGRTARAGSSGHAISFCSHDEKPRLRRIEKLTGHALTVGKSPSEKTTAQPSSHNTGQAPDHQGDSVQEIGNGDHRKVTVVKRPAKRRPRRKSAQAGNHTAQSGTKTVTRARASRRQRRKATSANKPR